MEQEEGKVVTKPEPEVDYKALYEKEKHDRESLDKYAKDLKNKYQAKLTDEEKRNTEIAEKEAYYRKLERELAYSKLKARLAGSITDEKTLDDISGKFADGNVYDALDALVKYAGEKEKNIRATIEQEILAKNPTPPPAAPTTKSWKDMTSEDWEQLRKENPNEYNEMLKTIK